MRMKPGFKNCGPVALKTATGIDYEDIIHMWPGEWGCPTDDTGKFNVPNDTPYDHFVLLQNLGLGYRKIETENFLTGDGIPEKTVLLLHLVPEAKTLWQKLKNFFTGTFNQHWVTLAHRDTNRNLIGVDWGFNNEDNVPIIKWFTPETMQRLLDTGWPQCIYEVTAQSKKLPWYKKWFANFF